MAVRKNYKAIVADQKYPIKKYVSRARYVTAWPSEGHIEWNMKIIFAEWFRVYPPWCFHKAFLNHFKRFRATHIKYKDYSQEIQPF